MNIVAIPNIDVQVWTQKSYLTHGNLPRSLTQPEITRQRSFELIYIEYD